MIIKWNTFNSFVSIEAKNKKLRNNYKFIFVPETINTYCAKKQKRLKQYQVVISGKDENIHITFNDSKSTKQLKFHLKI